MTENKTPEDAPTERALPFTETFKQFIPQGWAPYPSELPSPLPAAAFTPARRRALSAAFPGARLLIPAGTLVARNNDCDHVFRPDACFAYLTGLGEDREPDAVLVLEPTPDGHDAHLYFKPRSPRTDEEFYANPRYGEMWVGTRESLAEMAALTGLECRPISELDGVVLADAATTDIRIVPGIDPTLNALVAKARPDATPADHAKLAQAISELRIIKDEYEIAEIEKACSLTAKAIDQTVRSIPAAIANGRGERWIEGTYALHARHLGNGTGFSTIAAAGDHACTLHWVRNDGDLNPDDLLLLDCGVEVESLYTGDITRTFPLSGTFSPVQRRVYDAVLAANKAAIAAAKPGVPYLATHDAAVRVIAEHLHAWGILPVSVEETLDPETGGQHRRWMVHGTSHYLGLDVHDSAQARNERYKKGTLQPGMVVTIEPGLYFKSTDLLIPEEYRGIGVRIEDDILITEDGCRVLTHEAPKETDELERWLAARL